MRLWSFIIVLLLAAGLGVVIAHDPGYALFAYGEWTLEMPLWLSIVLLIVLVSASLLILNSIHSILNGSRTLQYWWKKHREHLARIQTYRGFLELSEGHWKNAERYLIKSAAHSDTPLLNYLSAAQAAEESGSPERRNHYLQLAFEASAGSEVAVRLTQAQLQLKHGELEQSIKNLQALYQDAPKHPQVLRLLCTLYEAMHHWQALYELLPQVRKTQALPVLAIEKLEQRITPALLKTYAEKGLKSLNRFWQESSRAVQANPMIVCEYARLLIQHSEAESAEMLLRTLLKQGWDPALMQVYGLAIGQNPKKQLAFAESFLPEHFRDPILGLSLGRLCMQNKLWGKARDYFEKSLFSNPCPETYAELGLLMDKLGLPEKAEEYYKKGLLLATKNWGSDTIHSADPKTLCLSEETEL